MYDQVRRLKTVKGINNGACIGQGQSIVRLIKESVFENKSEGMESN